MTTIKKSLQLANGVLLTNPGNVDPLYGPYSSTAEADSLVNVSLRPYKTVGIVVSGEIVEYWWPDETNIADGHLVIKTIPLPQPLGTGDNPSFLSLSLNGSLTTNNGDILTRDITSQRSSSFNTMVVNTKATITTLISTIALKLQSGSFFGSILWPTLTADRNYTFPDRDITIAGTDDVAAAVAAGNHYRGKYTSLSALQTAIVSGNDGDYAIVTASPNDQEYIWDSDHSAWTLTANIPAGTFAGLGGAPSDNGALASALASKVDQLTGYDLISSSDQTKLNGIASGATANSAAAQSDITTGTDNVKYLTSSLWSWIKTQVQTIAGIWNFSNGLQVGGNSVETQNNKDTSNGYAGLTSLKINFKNAANTFTSFFTNTNTASRTYTFKDRNGTILDDTDAATFVDLSSNQTVAGNKTLTGVTTVGATSPVLQLQTSTDSKLATLTRSTTNNTLTLTNNVQQTAGVSGGIQFTGSPSNQSITIPDTGFTSTGFILSIWIKTGSTVANQGIFSIGTSSFGSSNCSWSMGTDNNGAFCLNKYVYTSGSFGILGPVLSPNTVYYITAYWIVGSAPQLWVNNTQYSGSAFSGGFNPIVAFTSVGIGAFASNGNVQSSLATGNTTMTIDQALFYSSLSSTDRGNIYSSGGATVQTTGLLRRYDFETGSGSTAFDTVGGYNGTLVQSPHWTTNGIVPSTASAATGTFLTITDGVNISERGQLLIGDVLSGTRLQGLTIKHYINSLVPFIQDGNGYLLLNATNTNESSRSLSALGVVDGIAIGSYATTTQAPNNGLIVSAKSGFGVSLPTSWGHFGASSTSAGTAPIKLTTGALMTTPEAGAIEWDGADLYYTSGSTRNTVVNKTYAAANYVTLSSNNTYAGTQNYTNLVTYSGTILAASGTGRVVNYTNSLTATADNDVLIGLDLSNISYNTSGTLGTHITVNGVSITNGGSGYVNGTYSSSLPLTTITGSGSGATIFGIVVSGGVITSYGSIQPSSGSGSGYHVGDTLTVSNTLLGGTGSGLVFTVTGVTLTGATTLDLKVNSIQSSSNGTGRLGNGFTNWFSGVSAATIYTQGFRGIDNFGYDWLIQSGGQALSVTGGGNLNVNGLGRGTDTGYKIDATVGSLGSFRTTGTITAASAIARGVYFNNTLSPSANNDVLVGLDINPTISLLPTKISSLGTKTAGSGYTNGTYTAQALTGGTGSGATATIVAASGAISTVTLVSGGTGYTAGDTLSASIPGGSGFSIPVATVGYTGVTSLSLRTSGDIQIGGKLSIPTGSNRSAGTATLVSGTVTISNALVTANSIIMLSYRNPSGTTGTHLAQGAIVAGTSFVVNSLDTSSSVVTSDNNTFNWWIIN